MEQKHQDQNLATDKVLAFDTIFTTNHIKMLKILVSFLPPSLQKMLAVYIKFLELQLVLTYFDTHSSPFRNHAKHIGEIDLNALCNEIIPYCSHDERKKIDQFRQMHQMMDSFQQISQTMEMMKELFPDGIPGFDFGQGGGSTSAQSGSMPFGPDILSSLFGAGNNSQMFDMLAAMMSASAPFSSDKDD